ncbi:GNAT family N-acetyltransferase [Marimonas sp. MJW-29]|uniref:GNAT family N-acetyltransferase n=1 Tax=Sulfitobacter sediminis TaxID=3234186 RepID=A0ABV3RPH5_9RHOB
MQIEKAQEADLEAIAALWHAGWHQAHAEVVSPELVGTRTPSEFAARTAAHLAQTNVARIDGAMAGFFMLEGDELYQFYVDAAFQGQGVAAALMAEAEAALAGRLAWLACSVGNDRAAAFYEKAGWTRGAAEVYPVETASGPQSVTAWRFEKDLR